MGCRVFQAPSQTLRVYSDDINYNAINPVSYSGTVVMDLKNQLLLNIEKSQTIEQTSLFNVGWTWWTPNVDLDGIELLEQLKAALGANGVKVIAQDGGSITYSSHGWGEGTLTSLQVGSMYMIQTILPCSFTIEGPAIDVANKSITLSPGNNWIGFFGAQAMSVDSALANHTASIGDAITAQDGRTTYYSSHGWGGSLNNLVPGEAYIYNSKASSTQTFTFPLSIK